MPKNLRFLLSFLFLLGLCTSPGFTQTSGTPIKVRAVTATPSRAFTEVIYGARVEPRDRIDIRAPLTGVVEEFFIKQGDSVKAGTVLFTMRRDVTGRSFQAVEVKADTEGRVAAVLFRQGETISEGGRVLTLIDDSSLKIVILVSDRDISEIKVSDRCDLLNGATPLRTQGRISRIALEPDYTTGLFEVELAIPKNPEVWIGRFLRVKIKKDLFEGIVVESAHLSRRYGKIYLQVIKENGTMELREVVTGRVYGQRTALISGIKPGEKYIVWSERRLNDGEPVEIIR